MAYGRWERRGSGWRRALYGAEWNSSGTAISKPPEVFVLTSEYCIYSIHSLSPTRNISLDGTSLVS